MFDDPRAKIDRANENLDALTERVVTFANDAYTVEAEPNDWIDGAPQSEQGHILIWAEASRDPPAREWGPIIGDIVHGFRSALDQIAWSLSVSYKATFGVSPPADPIPRGDPWRNIWFPVCLAPKAWQAACANQLWAVDPSLLPVLEALQPYVTGQHAPEREPLAVLQELWNIDKHRHLHLVNETIELDNVLTFEPDPEDPHSPASSISFDVISQRAPGPLEGRTEIGRARLIPPKMPPGSIFILSHPQHYMDPRIAVDPAFEQGAPAYGGRVLHTLSQISEAIEAILAAVSC